MCVFCKLLSLYILLALLFLRVGYGDLIVVPDHCPFNYFDLILFGLYCPYKMCPAVARNTVFPTDCSCFENYSFW